MSDVNKQLLDAAKLVLQQAERNLAAVNLPVLEKLTAAIAAAEQAQQAEVVARDVLNEDLPDAVIEATAEAIGDAYDCVRVWEAWSVGTMGPDDFRQVADDSDRVAEIARAAIIAWHGYAAQPPAVAVPDGYALVPIEPTEEMIKEAAMYEWERGDAEGITYAGLYRAMLSAVAKP